ncbi:MAG: DUF302 domain-containing protein [Salinivirgaceae bacterium]
MNYYTSTTMHVDFPTAIQQVKAALKDEGFGVLSEIDIRQKMKEKMNTEFRNYTILGACNPPLALEALGVEDKVGVMLPCNVIVQELKPGEIEVASIDPFASMQVIDNDELSIIAKRVREKLENVVNALSVTVE